MHGVSAVLRKLAFSPSYLARLQSLWVFQMSVVASAGRHSGSARLDCPKCQTVLTAHVAQVTAATGSRRVGKRSRVTVLDAA